jgi:hypothetical protein
MQHLRAERGCNPVSHPKRRSKSRQAQAQRRLGNRECLTCRVSESGGRNCWTICRECLSTGQHGTMVVPGKFSRSPRGTHHGIIAENPQPWEWPGRSLIGPCPRERTQRNTHGRLIRAESSAGVNAPTASAASEQPRRRERFCSPPAVWELYRPQRRSAGYPSTRAYLPNNSGGVPCCWYQNMTSRNRSRPGVKNQPS